MQDLLRRLSRWELLLLALLTAFVLLKPFEGWSDAVLSVRVFLQFAVYAIGAVVLGRALVRLFKVLTRRLLWRVRHRMAAVFVFLGAIPLTLAFLLFGVGSFLLFGPLGAFMVTGEVEKRAEALYATADSLAWELRSAEPDDRRRIGRRFLADARQRYPGLLVRFETTNGPITFPPEFRMDPPPAGLESYRGVVRRAGDYYLAAYAEYETGAPSLLLMVPLSEEYLLDWLPGFGVVEPAGGFADAVEPIRLNRPQLNALPDQAAGSSALADMPVLMPMRLPDPTHPLDWPISRWPAETSVLDWETGETTHEDVFTLTTRSSAVTGLLFRGQSSEIEDMARNLGYALWAMFGVALLVSIVIAVSLTRTITSSINELYIGASHVSQGDFAYRTPVRGHTQLTELARSFNSMTASIEKLVEDSKERQKLESELAIASEMQRQLFPSHPPQLAAIDVLGVCRPANVVSGDFYDYVDLDHGRAAISFGDVAGKGISSALVMATAHSTIRTQLGKLRDGADLAKGVVDIVTETNRQLFDGTAPELFTTLFFGVYDSETSAFTYVNAGHLPPFLIRDGKRTLLEVTGVVIGAFPNMTYESRCIDLAVDDLLVAFTDGVTEPENSYGEEFGEDRLWESLRQGIGRSVEETITATMEEVVAWTDGPRQQDDMTMLLMRRRV
jgi:sigma-B regulation protein RsbU (phosphoserine phosphatase)